MSQLQMTYPGQPMGYRASYAGGPTGTQYSTGGGSSFQRSAGSAWWEYTGVPSAISGGVAAVGLNTVNQSIQVQAGGSIFSKAKYGFRAALALETVAGTAIVAAGLTIVDPYDKWDGGLDEWGFLGGNQQESLPGTMSIEEPNTFMWGLKQGHLGFLF
jgi:hypothetical protein